MNDEKDLTVNETFNLAIKNHQNNNLQDAKNYYQKVLKIDPDHLGALNNLGVIYKNLQENQKARDCYEKAIEIDPNYANAHNNLGVIFKNQKEYQKAKECFEKAIEINPIYVEAHYYLGVEYDMENHNFRFCLDLQTCRVQAASRRVLFFWENDVPGFVEHDLC